MSIRHRLRRLEVTIAGKDRFCAGREVYLWEPTNPESTAFLNEQIFHVPHSQRRYEIQIVGEPDRAVYNKLAKEHLPDRETLKKMTDEEIQSCLTKYMEATVTALNASRQKHGLPPVFAENGAGQERPE